MVPQRKEEEEGRNICCFSKRQGTENRNRSPGAWNSMSEPKYTCVSVVCNGESLVSHSELKTFRGIYNQEEINTF